MNMARSRRSRHRRRRPSRRPSGRRRTVLLSLTKQPQEADTWLSQVRGWLATVPDCRALTERRPAAASRARRVCWRGGYHPGQLPGLAPARRQTGADRGRRGRGNLQTLRDEEAALDEELNARRPAPNCRRLSHITARLIVPDGLERPSTNWSTSARPLTNGNALASKPPCKPAGCSTPGSSPTGRSPNLTCKISSLLGAPVIRRLRDTLLSVLTPVPRPTSPPFRHRYSLAVLGAPRG